jgi:hypothetical protein
MTGLDPRPDAAALVQALVFGAAGNAGACQIDGWSQPEDGFAWSIGARSRTRFAAAPGQGALVLDITVTPLLFPPSLTAQRVQVLVNDAVAIDDVLDGAATLAVTLSEHVSGDIVVTLCHPDAAIPAQLGMNGDTRKLGLMVQRMRLFRVPRQPAFLPRTLAPFMPDECAGPADAVRARTGLALPDLLSQFESLGHNCEFGLLQRRFGAEPLGLLRFGGVQPAHLLAGLASAFAGIGDAAGMEVMTGIIDGREEYLVRDGRYGVELHTNQFGGDVTTEELIAKMVPYLTFLQRIFAETLTEASRICVLHHPTIHNTARALPYLTQLQTHGPNTLLYITAHPTVPPGTIVQEQPYLLHGYTNRLPPMHEGDQVNVAAWASLCVNAHALWRAAGGGAGV